MSVFDNRRNDVSDALDEIYRTPAILLAADLTELRARSARLERERDSERVARLKAEAERDALRPPHDSAILAAIRETIQCERFLLNEARDQRDEALALLSKAREAWARWRAFRATFTRDGKPPELKGPAADLAKILGTGETT